jgi:hypothetical protein
MAAALTGKGFQRARRRLILAGLACAAVTGAARAEEGFDGSWGGASGDLTAQVIIAGGAVIGFYWRGDYVDADAAKPDDGAFAFTFRGGRARLVRTGERTARLEVDEAGRLTHMDLRRD